MWLEHQPVKHSLAARVPLFCSYHVLTSSVCGLLQNRRMATWNPFSFSKLNRILVLFFSPAADYSL